MLNYDTLFNIIGDSFLALSGLICFISIIYLTIEILKSRELKIKLSSKRLVKGMNKYTHLLSGTTIKKSLLYQRKDYKKLQTLNTKFSIDDTYAKNKDVFLTSYNYE